MSFAAAVLQEQINLRDALDAAFKEGTIDAAQFIGRRVRVDGGNYEIETTISNVLIAISFPDQYANPTVKNVRFILKDSVVSVKKKRFQQTRTIDHLSYAPACVSSDMKVVFKEDGLETIKAAIMIFLD